jgi:hypothetical protein
MVQIREPADIRVSPIEIALDNCTQIDGTHIGFWAARDVLSHEGDALKLAFAASLSATFRRITTTSPTAHCT